MKTSIFTLVFSLMVSVVLAQDNDMQLITKTLTDYIEGSTNGQPNRLKTAFYKDLNLYSVRNDSITIWSGKAYIKIQKKESLRVKVVKLFL